MLARCGQQLRVGFGGAFGMDFGSVMAIGTALGADMELLADALPGVETARIAGLSDAEGDDDGSDD